MMRGTCGQATCCTVSRRNRIPLRSRRSDLDAAVNFIQSLFQFKESHRMGVLVENLNDVFEEFAAYFAGGRDCDRPMAHSGLLKRDRLDYTVASLETVDEYLKYLHEHWHGQTGGEWDRAVLWGGAYVGEVIRRYAPRPWLSTCSSARFQPPRNCSAVRRRWRSAPCSAGAAPPAQIS